MNLNIILRSSKVIQFLSLDLDQPIYFDMYIKEVMCIPLGPDSNRMTRYKLKFWVTSEDPVPRFRYIKNISFTPAGKKKKIQ